LIPWKGRSPSITLVCSEFTSRCPVTGQPDFATLEVTYQPYRSIVETKSWKLYLWSFREERAFNETLAQSIANDFAAQVNPHRVVVEMKFHARGGIAVHVEATA
jgi:7-cyano-7-deazaguanine reductase